MTNKINNSDIICFIDYLLFQNYLSIWKTEYFLVTELFEKISNLIMEQNCKELIFDSKQVKSKKPKHRKKKKNNYIIKQTQKEEEKNDNKILSEYEGIFKDEEEELYAPYFLRADTEQKKLYLKYKGKYNYENNEKEEIEQFISKTIILGIIIDNVFLTPLNSGLDFYEEYNNINVDKNKDNLEEEKEEKDKKEKEKKEEEKIEEKGNEQKGNFKDKEKVEEKDNEEEKEKIELKEKEDINKINNSNIIMDDQKENFNIIRQNISCNVNLDINKSLSNISKDNELEKSDSLSLLSLKSDNINSEIDKTTTTNTIDNNNNNEKNNEDKKDDLKNNKDNYKKKKKNEKEKEQTFFLYNTVKKKNKKNNHKNNDNNNALISKEFNIIVIKEPNQRLSFFDKLHNDIIKYETKVITLLNHSMKFKDYCIKEIERIIQETFSSPEKHNIDVYGSYATGLMIEASDIDIKIKINNGKKPELDNLFETICKKLESEQKFDVINPIGTASVPVIKLVLSLEKIIKGKVELENSFKQFKELYLFKHYIFDQNELTKLKIDVTFILSNDNNINENIINNNTNNSNNNNETEAHDHDKSLGGEMSSVVYVKEQIVKYPEVKFILRVLKRYFYWKKMNTSFLGGLSSYNLFLLLLSYAKYRHKIRDQDCEIIENNIQNNKPNTHLGYFLSDFLNFFKCLDFKLYIIDINSQNIYNRYDSVVPEKAKEYNFGKSIVIIDPLTGVNASKSSYKIEEIEGTFIEACDFFQNEKLKYEKEGKTKVSKNNNNKYIVMGLPITNKNDNNHGGGVNIIEKFLGK